jgi:hypothetical protein
VRWNRLPLIAIFSLTSTAGTATDLDKLEPVEYHWRPFSAGVVHRVDAMVPSLDAIAAGDGRLLGDHIDLRPTFSPLLHGTTRRKLSHGYALAAGRVRNQPSCRSLFSKLGADGLDLLEETLYLPASKRSERRICNHASRTFTRVGSDVTMLCGNFEDLPDRVAAVLLIHEALHFAGLDDEKHDPDGLSSKEINTMIEHACGLSR